MQKNHRESNRERCLTGRNANAQRLFAENKRRRTARVKNEFAGSITESRWNFRACDLNGFGHKRERGGCEFDCQPKHGLAA